MLPLACLLAGLIVLTLGVLLFGRKQEDRDDRPYLRDITPLEQRRIKSLLRDIQKSEGWTDGPAWNGKPNFGEGQARLKELRDTLDKGSRE